MPTFSALVPQGSHFYLFKLHLVIISLIISDNKHILLFLDLLTLESIYQLPIIIIENFLPQLFSIFPVELQFSVKPVLSIYTVMTVNIVRCWWSNIQWLSAMIWVFVFLEFIISFSFICLIICACAACLSLMHRQICSTRDIVSASQTHQMSHQFFFPVLKTSLHSILSSWSSRDSGSLAQLPC